MGLLNVLQAALRPIVLTVWWLLKHENLGRERAAPHQPSPAPRKWRGLFRHFTAGPSPD